MMSRRGRPIEQLQRETTVGRVWVVISKLREAGDFSKSIRDIARLCKCSTGAVSKSPWWQPYLREKEGLDTTRAVNDAEKAKAPAIAGNIEGRVMQIVRDAATRNDFSLSVRQIAAMIGCSPAAVHKTHAWEGYVRARENDKEASQIRRRGRRIK